MAARNYRAGGPLKSLLLVVATTLLLLIDCTQNRKREVSVRAAQVTAGSRTRRNSGR
jgi:hypothetical protein